MASTAVHGHMSSGMEPDPQKIQSILNQASSKSKTNPQEAITLYRQIIAANSDNPSNISNEAELKAKETAIFALAELIPDATTFVEYVKSLELLWQSAGFVRAKPAFLVKKLQDVMATKFAGDKEAQLALCNYLLDWAERDKRVVLKRALLARQAQLYYDRRMFSEALHVIQPLARDLIRIDDKLALIEVQLLEGKVYMELKNLSKAKAAFTAARTTGNLIVSPPLVQAALDIQSGKLYVEEGEPNLAYANFIEALDGYNTEKHRAGAVQALHLMLLAKIMANATEDIPEILKSKMATPYAAEAKSMVAIAEAYAKKSLAEYDTLLTSNQQRDPFLLHHLRSLYDSLLEGNLLKLVAPYSRVQIPHIAAQLGLEPILIEQRLCQMILDGSLNAIIDQEAALLILLEPAPDSSYHKAAMQTIANLSLVVEGLCAKAGMLH